MIRRSSAVVPVFLLAAAGSSSAAERGGEEIYVATCASCHGVEGRGASASLTGLPIKPRDFTDCRRTTPEPDHDWHAVVVGGGPARGLSRLMPAFGEVLSESEQEAAVAYVRSFCPEPSWPRGDLNFPRPLVTEKAFVEDEVVLTGAVATRHGHASESYPIYESRLVYEQRFLKRQMFELVLPFGVVGTEDGTRQAGLGDIAVSLKSILVASKRTGSILSVGAEVQLPTGNKEKDLGTKGALIIEPFLAYGQALPWDSFLQVQTGAELPTKEDSDLENEGFVRAALGTTFAYRRFGRSFSPMVELVAFREIKRDATTSLNVVPQIQVSLSRRQHVLASLGGYIPTARDAKNPPKIMFYLLWDWFDGGLFESW
jgi:mono/diheme cytochrome c family protein